MSFLSRINDKLRINWSLISSIFLFIFVCCIGFSALGIEINGDDLSSDLETVGSLFKTADTITFGWVSPFAAGIFGIIACIGLVRSHFMLFITCLVAAILILLVPKIVGEIKKKGGDSIFESLYEHQEMDVDHV